MTDIASRATHSDSSGQPRARPLLIDEKNDREEWGGVGSTVR
ncbi:hypothetical protein [Natronorubrum aibiense]|nr:hypothetical protein [Natronorubrum aibiense]